MTPKEIFDTLGKLVYRRSDYAKAMSEDTGINRMSIARIKENPILEKHEALILKGFCQEQALELERAAQKLRKIAEIL